MQGGTCGTENCDRRGLIYSAWPIRVGWVAGSGWMPIWLTNADQLRSAHAEPGSQSNQPQSGRVTCGSSVKSVFWIWSLRPGCSKVSWDLWKGTIASVPLFSHSFNQNYQNIAYPLDIVFIFDRCCCSWQNIFIHGDIFERVDCKIPRYSFSWMWISL